jgi:hypothetical protein
MLIRIDKKDHPPVSVFWTKKFIWNNKGDTAVLYNAEGDLVDHVTQSGIKIPKRLEM